MTKVVTFSDSDKRMNVEWWIISYEKVLLCLLSSCCF